jgi:galacturan 1,4-alpha-galacturonidase
MGFAILEVLGKGLRRQNMDETHSTLDLHGFLTFFTDIGNWINNRNHLPIPEPTLAFVITGHEVTLDGHGSGEIDGNGQVWYDGAKDEGNKFR